jgi:hypothetical protein
MIKIDTVIRRCNRRDRPSSRFKAIIAISTGHCSLHVQIKQRVMPFIFLGAQAYCNDHRANQC